MSLVQLNAIREILADAKQRIDAIDPLALPPPARGLLNAASQQLTNATARVARIEERTAKDLADTGGADDP